MKCKVAILGLAMGILYLQGCTSDFENKNTNPEQATDEMLDRDGLRTGSPFSQMTRNVVPTFQLIGDEEYGSSNYQIIQDLAGNIFAGYTGAVNSGFTANNRYNITAATWYNAMFDDAYVRLIEPWRKLNDMREDFPEVAAMADIVKVAGMHRVTDTYGPIPYSAITNSGLSNSYDSQQEVYNAFFEELGDAITVLTDFYTGNPDATLLEDYDNVFYGNVGRWVKFANTLRLRLAMRIVYADPTLARQQAEAAASNVVGLMNSIADIAQVNRPANATWEYPLYAIQYTFNDGDSRVGATIVSYMNGYNDPRRPYYFTSNSDGEYRGVRNGINITNLYATSSALSLINCTNNDPVLWMAPAEAYFLMAEGALRNWNMGGGTAREYYEQGIALSFATAGAGSADSYIADTTNEPAAFVDAVGSNGAAQPSTVKIAWDTSNNFETNLEQIITQKYIAMFPDGQEAWTEFRRTGYPKIFPVVVNNSGGAIDTGKQIRRLNFPSTEYATNGEAVQEAISILASESSSGTLDNGGTHLWWDKK